ncbi:MAG: XRE family transcriptional regulator [Phenylobacterium sp.]|nr:MAG: XRE family transcriptional regulator [Phenylobacterium sp.]
MKLSRHIWRVMKFQSFSTDEFITAKLGRRLEAERLAQDLTQAQLATQAGVSKRTVERLENGESSTLSNGRAFGADTSRRAYVGNLASDEALQGWKGPPSAFHWESAARWAISGHARRKNSRAPDGVAARRLGPGGRCTGPGERKRRRAGGDRRRRESLPEIRRLSEPSKGGERLQHLQRLPAAVEMQDGREPRRSWRLVQSV